MPIYYVNHTGGSDANGGTHPTTDAWLTVAYAIARTFSPGDTIRVRGGGSYVETADCAPVSDGTINARITIEGIYTAAGSDDWGDGNTTRPIINFNTGAYQFILNGDDHWTVKSLDIIESRDALGGIRFNNCLGITVEDCRIYDNQSSSANSGLRIDISSRVEIIDCIFDNNVGRNVEINGSSAHFIGCTFNGDGDNALGNNATSTDYGIRVDYGFFTMDSCIFGKDTNGDHDVADIYLESGSFGYGRNVDLDSSTQVVMGDTGICSLSIEDVNQTHLAMWRWATVGNVSRSTTVERSGSGGTAWSVLMEPNSNCGVNGELVGIGGQGNKLVGLPIYLDGTEQTVTIYAYATSWVSLPTVSQFVMELTHYESAGVWATDTSSDTFAANDQWESFAITLTPGAAGPAYLRVYLKDYEDGTEKIYIDPAPVIS